MDDIIEGIAVSEKAKIAITNPTRRRPLASALNTLCRIKDYVSINPDTLCRKCQLFWHYEERCSSPGSLCLRTRPLRPRMQQRHLQRSLHVHRPVESVLACLIDTAIAGSNCEQYAWHLVYSHSPGRLRTDSCQDTCKRGHRCGNAQLTKPLPPRGLSCCGGTLSLDSTDKNGRSRAGVRARAGDKELHGVVHPERYREVADTEQQRPVRNTTTAREFNTKT